MLRVTNLVGFAVPPGDAAAPVATHSLLLPGTLTDFLTQNFVGIASSSLKATIAFFFKTADLSNQKCLMSTGSASVDTDSDFIQHLSGTGGVMQSAINNRAMRRTSATITTEAWRHLCVGIDSTLGTQPPRMTVEVDLVDVSTHVNDVGPSEAFNWLIQGRDHVIGHRYLAGARSQAFPGQIAELHMIDGAKLPGTEFAVDDAGTVKAIDYDNAHGFGGNGNLLKFQDDQDLGKDFSGNDLHWTTVGTGLTQSSDAPPSL